MPEGRALQNCDCFVGPLDCSDRNYRRVVCLEVSRRFHRNRYELYHDLETLYFYLNQHLDAKDERYRNHHHATFNRVRRMFEHC